MHVFQNILLMLHFSKITDYIAIIKMIMKYFLLTIVS